MARKKVLSFLIGVQVQPNDVGVDALHMLNPRIMEEKGAGNVLKLTTPLLPQTVWIGGGVAVNG
jgi:hypothetical protein